MTTTQAASRPRSNSGFGRFVSLVVFLFLTQAVAAGGSIATRSGQDWYDGVKKPSFNPPNWVFAPVWTTLYVLMSVAAWLVYQRRPERWRLAQGAWGVQLGLNLAWSVLFFGLRRPGLALGEIGLLFASILVTIGMFWKVRIAALLMVPYACWVAFASALNLQVWRLN